MNSLQNGSSYKNNDKLRALMLTRGWKVPYVTELMGNLYAKNTINKWHARIKPMSDRAWELLQAKMAERGL